MFGRNRKSVKINDGLVGNPNRSYEGGRQESQKWQTRATRRNRYLRNPPKIGSRSKNKTHAGRISALGSRWAES